MQVAPWYRCMPIMVAVRVLQSLVDGVSDKLDRHFWVAEEVRERVVLILGQTESWSWTSS